MRKLTLLVTFMLLTGCSHSIKRYGYDMDKKMVGNDTCQIIFLRNMPFDSTKFNKVGRIKLGDTGFSNKCYENDALQILKNEACILGADAVNITDEKRPDFWSTCYRVEAEFLKHTNLVAEQSDSLIVIGEIKTNDYKHYSDSSAVMLRVKNDKKRNRIMILIACGAGLLTGVLLTSSF